MIHYYRYKIPPVNKIIFLLFMLGTIRVARSQGEAITVSFMGDIPYSTSEIPVFQQQMDDHNLYSPSEFLFHLGDIKSATEPCDETRYIIVADMLKSLAVPAFIVPGDNEWIDCNDPNQGWLFWETHLLGIEAYSCGAEHTERQAVRTENFSIVQKGVLFIGVNLVGGTTQDPNEWNQIIQDDSDWITEKFQQYGSQVRAAVVMAQAGPNSSKRKPFFDQLEVLSAALGKPVLMIHGDGHSWIQDNPFSESNMMRVQVENGIDEDPVQLTVTMDTQSVNTAFDFLRNPWSGNPSLYNVPPCVKAGDDQVVSVLSGIDLQGSVKDDGVPLSPGTPTLTWSKVSGPGVATFGDPHADTTTVSFSASGIYVLRLTADDGQLVSEDEVTIDTDAGGLAIYSFTPTSGLVGTELTITGLHFNGTTDVSFNGASASVFTVDSDTQVRAEVPAGATVGKISMTNANSTGFSLEDFVVINTPVITSFSPGEGPVLTEVSVSGTDFTAVTEVSFNGVLADSFFVDSDTLLLAYVPAGASSGAISLTNLAGTTISSGSFTVTHIPIIVGFTPAAGATGTEVTVRGYNFTTATAVAFNSTPANSFSVDSDTSLRVVVPNGASSGKISVTNTDGSTESSTDFTVAYPPVISSFYPAFGEVGIEVAITGSNFSLANEVAFNGISAGSFNIDSDTQIRVVVPSGATSGKISVGNPVDTVQSVDDFYVSASSQTLTFYPTDDARVTSNSPDQNYAYDASLRIKNSSSKTYHTYLQFDLSGLNSTVEQATLRLYCNDASNDGGSIYVVDNNWDETTLTWNNAPAIGGTLIANVGPASMDTWMEIDVTSAISGNGILSLGMQSNDNDAVYYSSKEGPQIPELVLQTGSSLRPFVSSFTPTSGSAAGGEITISGSNFSSAVAVMFNGVASPGFTIDSDASLRAMVPLNATTGKIAVINSHGTGISQSNFTVTTAFELTTNISGSGSINLNPPGGIYDSAAVVTLTAIPNPDHIFVGWSGDLTGSTNPESMVMDTNKVVTAIFAPQFSLTANISGRGSVTLDPAGGVYDSLTTVTLMATPDSGYIFAGWSGDLDGNANPNSVVMDTSKSVTAIFIRRFSLTATVSGAGAVTLDPAGGVYDSLTTVTLTATPDPGYVFTGWSGDLTGTANPDSVIMDTNKSITANFETIAPPVVNVKAFLEGPYQNGSMNTIVKDNGELPLAQPYNSSPWNYNGGESVSSIPADVVDWVLVGLRSTETTAELFFRAAFIKSDGSIVDTSGSGGVKFEGVPYGDYFVVIYHRNHLAIMSNTAQTLSDASVLYDFSTAMNQAYGTNPMVGLASGVFGMIGGDGNSDGIVNEADKALWRVENGTHWLYSKFGDFNIDGGIDALDLNYGLRINSGLMTGVPGVSTAKVTGKNVGREKETRGTLPESKSKKTSVIKKAGSKSGYKE